jgi:hypothetical protein
MEKGYFSASKYGEISVKIMKKNLDFSNHFRKIHKKGRYLKRAMLSQGQFLENCPHIRG